MALFFVHTAEGHVATQRQLLDAGVMSEADGLPPRPWHRAQGSGDATTLWHAVLRRRERGVWLATLVMRHSDHEQRLRESGWEEVPPNRIGEGLGVAGTVAPSPWSA